MFFDVNMVCKFGFDLKATRYPAFLYAFRNFVETPGIHGRVTGGLLVVSFLMFTMGSSLEFNLVLISVTIRSKSFLSYPFSTKISIRKAISFSMYSLY